MTEKFWTVLSLNSDGGYHGGYKSLGAAHDAARKKTASDRDGDAYAILEAVAVTKPVVPNIEITTL